MRVAIFGANGATGRLLTERCLAAGYEVSALLRKPEEFKLADRVRVVKGSAFQVEDVMHALDGTELDRKSVV